MKEEINFSPKVVIFEDGGSLAPNIPSPYKFNGTKIFRDTTALPFLDGGPLVEKTNHGKLLNSIYASDLGPYHYALGGNMPGPTDCEVGYIWDGTRCIPEEEYRTAAANKLPKGWTPDAAIDVNRQYRESKDWMQSYFASPEYNRLLKNSTEGNPEEYEDIKSQRQTNLDNINLPTFAAESKLGDKKAGESDSHGAMTTYPVGVNVNSLQTHELSHGTNVGKTNFPGVTYDLIPQKDSELMASGKFNNFKESPEYFNNQSLYEDNKKEFRQY